MDHSILQRQKMISKEAFKSFCFLLAVILMINCNAQTNYPYPFQNPDLNMEKRIDNIISLLTVDEKITCLGTNPSIPRLGIKGSGHIEGLHGVALGIPGGWG